MDKLINVTEQALQNLQKFICKNQIAVIDIETTGLNCNPQNGNVDHIIEIGGVKIRKGIIIGRFSTFVNCPVPLSDEIKEITHITDDDLKNAPTIENALLLLQKFTGGCIIMGHNVLFDLGFINHYGSLYNIEFGKNYADTLQLSRKILKGKLKNFKLGTTADYFNITFESHRAYNDAHATAQILLNLAQTQQ
jgi:DNA polymerase-3 subunit alpha (Gram-positive type)